MIKFDLERIQATLSSKYHKFEFLNSDTCPPTVLDALINMLPEIPEDSWEHRSSYGGIYLNGRKTTLNQQLKAPVRLEYYEPNNSSKCWNGLAEEWIASDNLIYEDEYLLAVWKPAGIPCLASKEQTHYNIKAFLEKSYQSVHLPSRLDHSTCGILIASKNRDFHPKLQKLFEQHQISKTYLLITENNFSWKELQVDSNIERDPRHRILRRTSLNSGKTASTRFQVLQTKTDETLVQANPLTGRTHQIRVHAAYNGFPIVGDNFYSGKVSDNLNLCCYQLDFIHPVSSNRTSIKVPEHLLPNWLISWDISAKS